MIIFFSIITGQLVRVVPKKRVLALGLIIYTIGGIGAHWSNSIISLLVCRALLGAGTGLIGPLSISLITDFYSGIEHAKMVGFSSFTSYIGAAISPIITGVFINSNWRNAFFIYLIALVVLLFTGIYLPSTKKDTAVEEKILKSKITRSMIIMSVLSCFAYTVFYLIPTDISFLIKTINDAEASSAALLLAIEILLAAASAGVLFSKFTHKLGVFAFSLGFAFCTGGFLMVNFTVTLNVLIICVIAIGLGISTLRPMIYFHTSQVTLPENMTSTFAFINSGF